MQAKLEDRADLRFGELVGLGLALRLDGFDQRDVRADLGARPFAGEQLSRASAGLADPRISFTTSSRLVTATTRPSKMWARSRAFSSSNFERRVMTSSRYLTKLSMMSRSVSVSGRPPRIASMFAGKEDCAGVCRHNWLSTTSGVASRFRSMTIRTPSRLDSSRMSETPSMRLSLAASAIFSTRPDLPTWYGISVRTIDRRSPGLPRSCSASAS